MLLRKTSTVGCGHAQSLRSVVPTVSSFSKARNHQTFQSSVNHYAQIPSLKASLKGNRGAISTTVNASQPRASQLGDAGKEKILRVRYIRRSKDYVGWGIHVWGDAATPTEWHQPMYPVGFDARGVYWDVPLKSGARSVSIVVHNGDSKSAGADFILSDIDTIAQEVWLVGDSQHPHILPKNSDPPSLANEPAGNLMKQCAIWVSRDIIAWRHPLNDVDGNRQFSLHYSASGKMSVDGQGVQNSEQVFELEPVGRSLPPELAAEFPYLSGCSALKLPSKALSMVRELVQGQVAVSMRSGKGEALDATILQMQGGLDAFFKYDGPLGCWWDDARGIHMVAVWAPTAQSMELLHFPTAQGSEHQVLAMDRDVMGPGIWSTELPKDSLWTYYKYRINVWCPWTGRFEVTEVTDPYAKGLSANGERVWVVPIDLEHESLVPAGWHTHQTPAMDDWMDISLYELHIRDFSIADQLVPPHLRGKFLAFVPEAVKAGNGGQLSHGLEHLAKLREAGMNHLHLLPMYDFATVPERPEEQLAVQEDLSKYPADSDKQQAAVLSVADQDGFNWGYDPVHWSVPDGSYATNADGAARIRECREMIMSLHAQGWRVVMDVVYNHVFAGKLDRFSVLDKLVPGYYLRRDEDGTICQSTCCNNTATEFYMAERLAVDDIVFWAKQYKADGFRFDIMGHMLVRTLEKQRSALDALTLDRDGVDGKKIYIYGEAWNFGEVVNNQRGINCSQLNITGTGLGSFNDRLRDGALGGGPFSPHDQQGFATGLHLTPNASVHQGDAEYQRKLLLQLSDWIRYSLAGNLRQYKMESSSGEVMAGEAMTHEGVPIAYGGLPCEHVAFIGCHDNLTMFDFVTEKAPASASAEERVRMHLMCLALITFSQGIPFVHAGDDLLRSKSLDRDSYNSGDWFNAMDWTGETHKLGVGLPVATKNAPSWHYKAPILANASIRPSPQQIRASAAVFRQLLRIRYSSPLFRLRTVDQIHQQVLFHNTGPSQVPGAIVMELVSGPEGGSNVYDALNERIVVVFNAAPEAQELPYPASAAKLQLHSEQLGAQANDPYLAATACNDVAKRLTVAPRTAAVFVQPR